MVCMFPCPPDSPQKLFCRVYHIPNLPLQPFASILILWTFKMNSVSLTRSKCNSPRFYHIQFPWYHLGSQPAPQNSLHDSSSTQKRQGQGGLSSSLPTLHVLVTPHNTLRTTVSAALALLSHPMQSGFIQILKCLSISSAGFTQSLLCFMLPHPNYYFLSIILIANSKHIKRWG